MIYLFLCATLCVLCELCVTKKELAQRATEKAQRATELNESLAAVILFLIFFAEFTTSFVIFALVF